MTPRTRHLVFLVVYVLCIGVDIASAAIAFVEHDIPAVIAYLAFASILSVLAWMRCATLARGGK